MRRKTIMVDNRNDNKKPKKSEIIKLSRYISEIGQKI